MDRSEFIKFLAATPFAFKSLLTEHGKSHIEQYSKDIKTVDIVNTQGFSIKDTKGNIIGVSNNYSVLYAHSDLPHSNLKNEQVTIAFNRLHFYNRKQIWELFEEENEMNCEIYAPEYGKFAAFKAVLIELSESYLAIDEEPIWLSGEVLVVEDFEITYI